MPEWINHPAPWAIVGIAILAAVIRVSMWIGAVNADRISFKEFMKEIRNKVDKILERLPPPGVTTAASPLRLNELGMNVSTEVGAKELARELVDVLRERVIGMDEYDLQETCLSYLQNDYEPALEVDARIKKVAFDNGLPKEQVLRVIGFELRDMLATELSD